MITSVNRRVLGRAALLLGLLAAGTGLATAEGRVVKLYKYVDTEGEVTYSERRPEGASAEALELRGFEPGDSDAREKLDALQERLESNQKDRDFQASYSKEVREREERIKKNCEVARENLRILSTSARIQAMDESGNPYFLDPPGIDAKRAQSQSQVDLYCQ